MRSVSIFSSLLLCAAAGATAVAGATEAGDSAAKLEAVLGKMDAAAAQFRGMIANLKQVAHTAVINEDQVQSGTIRMKRVKPGDTRMLVDFLQPDPKTVQLQSQILDIYLPKIKTVQEYDLGKNSSFLEQYLLLGFGTTRKDLASQNAIEYGGNDSVDGAAAVKLILKPKSKDVLSRIQKIELWLRPENGLPLQHKIYQPGGDYQLFVFTQLKMNPPDLSDASLRLKLPKNVKKETPQR